MDLYEGTLVYIFVGFGMGTMLANFYTCGIIIIILFIQSPISNVQRYEFSGLYNKMHLQ